MRVDGLHFQAQLSDVSTFRSAYLSRGDAMSFPHISRLFRFLPPLAFITFSHIRVGCDRPRLRIPAPQIHSGNAFASMPGTSLKAFL